MESGKKPIIDDRIKLLFEAIRDEQATIFSIDWKARTILMVNSITVPLMLGSISFYSLKREVFQNLSLHSPVALLLFCTSILLLLALATVFFLTLKVISPRSRPTGRISYPEDLGRIRDLDVYFPAPREDRVDFAQYRKKLQQIEDKETLELILLSELLSVSLIREDKNKTLRKALLAMGINAAFILTGLFLFLLLIL